MKGILKKNFSKGRQGLKKGLWKRGEGEEVKRAKEGRKVLTTG